MELTFLLAREKQFVGTIKYGTNCKTIKISKN